MLFFYVAGKRYNAEAGDIHNSGVFCIFGKLQCFKAGTQVNLEHRLFVLSQGVLSGS